MKISVLIQKKIIKLLINGLTHRQIANQVHVSPTTVGSLVQKLQHTDVDIKELLQQDNQQFIATLQTERVVKPKNLKPVADFNYIHDQMKIRDMTLKQLWLEFKESEPNGVSYSRFVRLYKVWQKSLHSSMRQHFIAGQTLLVDFCGKTVPIYDLNSDHVRYVQIFVGVLGGSSLINTVAVETQRTEDWLKCFQITFEKLGGIPREVITDNLKAAVIKVSRKGSEFNQAFEQFADYHNFAILNTRSRSPKDKGLVEVSVQIIQRSVLVKLRHRKFFSLAELQKALDIEVEQLNKKITKRFPESRWDRFIRIEKNQLQSLTQQPYPFSQWIFQQTVSEFYQFTVLDNIYSVPHILIGKKVDIGITDNHVNFYVEGELVTSHLRLFSTEQLSILSEHMPVNHRLYQALSPASLKLWAQSQGQFVIAFFEKILAKSRKFSKNVYSLNKLRSYVEDSNMHHILDQASEYALQYQLCSVTDLIYILKNKTFIKTRSTSSEKSLLHSNLRGADYFRGEIA